MAMSIVSSSSVVVVGLLPSSVVFLLLLSAASRSTAPGRLLRLVGADASRSDALLPTLRSVSLTGRLLPIVYCRLSADFNAKHLLLPIKGVRIASECC